MYVCVYESMNVRTNVHVCVYECTFTFTYKIRANLMHLQFGGFNSCNLLKAH